MYPVPTALTTAIERKWGASKRFARDNCNYTITSLRTIIPQALASVPLFLSRRFYQKSLRYLKIYETVQCSAPLPDLICRTYRSHRRVNDVTVEGAIRKAAKANPEQRQALLALLEPSQPQPMVTMSLSGGGAGGESDPVDDEVQADDGDPEWEDVD